MEISLQDVLEDVADARLAQPADVLNDRLDAAAGPMLRKAIEESGSDCAVLSFLDSTDDEPVLLQRMYVVGPDHLSDQFRSYSFAIPKRFDPPVKKVMQTWGRKSFPNGYSAIDLDESDLELPEKLFNGWIREKAWFPLSLRVDSSPLFGLVCLIRGEDSSGHVFPYTPEEIVSAWYALQSSYSRQLPNVTIHQEFASAISGFRAVAGSATRKEFWERLFSTVLAPLGWRGLLAWRQESPADKQPSFTASILKMDSGCSRSTDVEVPFSSRWIDVFQRRLPMESFICRDESKMLILNECCDSSALAMLRATSDEFTCTENLRIFASPIDVGSQRHLVVLLGGEDDVKTDLQDFYSVRQLTTLLLEWSSLVLNDWSPESVDASGPMPPYVIDRNVG